MNEMEQLKQKVAELEKQILFLVRSDRYLFQRDIELTEGRNVKTSGLNGTKISTTASQKIAFHGSTPVIQRTSASQAAVATTAATQTTPYGYTTAAQANAIVTLVNELRAALVEKGIIKGS
jgi:uncharacterized protein YkwD